MHAEVHSKMRYVSTEIPAKYTSAFFHDIFHDTPRQAFAMAGVSLHVSLVTLDYTTSGIVIEVAQCDPLAKIRRP